MPTAPRADDPRPGRTRGGRAIALSLLALLALGCDGPCDPSVPGIVCRIAGTGELGFNRDGHAPAESDFYLLSAVRRGPDDRLYLMDFNNMRLRRIDPDGLVRTVVGNGFHALADTTLPAEESPLENPIDFAFGPAGELVFVQYHDPRVIRVEPDGHLRVLAGTGEVAMRGDEGDYEDALFAQFIQLDGIAIGDDGAIYVSDSLANRVRVIRDGVVYPFAGDGEARFAGDGGPATAASLHWPTAIELDADGGLLIADSQNHAVRRVAPDGTIRTVAGDGVEGFEGDGGLATAARLDEPNGLAIDDDGTIYIADRGNFRVRRVTPDGLIETIAGRGTQGSAGDGGPALDAAFGYVARIALDEGTLLVADQSNSCARRITLP
ncbi:MAG: SMP-30/gluconolactonase/LRE family protein [Sandaracinaceae bacterium]|nr:SMP-30/gluconolactonase/LRE family protein [Sandaracinaceae bacterium]